MDSNQNNRMLLKPVVPTNVKFPNINYLCRVRSWTITTSVRNLILMFAYAEQLMFLRFQTCFSIRTSYFQNAINYAKAYRLTMALLFAIEFHNYDVAFSYNAIGTMIRNWKQFVLQGVIKALQVCRNLIQFVLQGGIQALHVRAR